MSTDPKSSAREAEFVQLTEPHHQHLYGIALALCRDPDQAADLTQEALIRAYQAFDRFRPGAPVLPWLRSILRNLFLDSFKTSRARHEVTDRERGAADGPPLADVADERPDALDRLERAELRSWVGQEIAAMSEAHQQVLALCVMQELGFNEAAELLGIPVGTVASRLGRARAELRQRLLRRAAASGVAAPAPVGTPVVDEVGAPTRRSSGEPGEDPNGARHADGTSVKVGKTPP